MARSRLFASAPEFPDRVTLLETLGRHTRFVRASKATLVLLILVLLGTLLLLPLVRGDRAGLRIAFTSTPVTQASVPVMKNPRFQGTDAKMQPYMVTADTAIQQDGDTVVLSKVEADLTLESGAWLSLHADQGTLKRSEEKLYLIGEVKVFHDGGYEMHSDRVGIDMTVGIARSDTPVEGQGPLGTLKASGFTASDRGKTLEFHGPVALTIHPERN